MDVDEAVLSRRSIRAFRPEPVPRAVLEDIIRIASWSPSGYNIQPWYLSVVTGMALEKLRHALVERSKADPEGKPEVSWYNLGEAHKERRRRLGYRVLEAKGIAREDRAGRAEWNQQMLRFFNAPAAMVIQCERSMGEIALCDLGMLSMSLMLTAHNHGLGTCALGMPSMYPDIVRAILGLPSDRLIVLSLAIGYPSQDAPVNSFQREREPVESFVRWH
ncbi:MAG: nitroreductase [Chloroflexota bacterium]